MSTLLHIVHVVAALFLVLVILLQSGRGGGMGAAFGGASGHIFGGRGAAPFLAKVTTVFAAIFFLTSMGLSAMSSRHRSVLFAGRSADALTDAPIANDVDAPEETVPAAAEAEAPDQGERGQVPPAAATENKAAQSGAAEQPTGPGAKPAP